MLSFDNTEYAFEYKSDKELRKAHFLFSSMGKPWLVKAGLAVTPLAIRFGLPFTKSVIRKTIFSQFVGGETLADTAAVAQRLHQYGVDVILDYGVEGGGEGEQGFDHACDEFIRVISYAGTQTNVPFMSIKVTGLARFGLLEVLDSAMAAAHGNLRERYEIAKDAITESEKAEWERVIIRLRLICETAAAKKIGVLVDAEETWIQDPVDAATMEMMEHFNQDAVVVFNTVQLYRKDRLNFLKASLASAQAGGFIFGVKPVRGAYMEKERRRAAEKNYPSPIQDTKEDSDRDFNAAIAYALDHLSDLSLIIASHNEVSNLKAATIMDEKQIAHDHPRVHFSQLYGMSDNITFNLAKAGFNVSKYLPFGPIGDVIPYLMRRAQENSSVAGQTGRELGLIKKELARRKA